VVSVGEGTGEGIGEGEPSGSGESLGSERGLIPDRVSDESPPAHAGIVYLLSELYPELASGTSGAYSAAIPLHEIVLGKL
jgi:hypothetical protein